jgi:hypothetical protein
MTEGIASLLPTSRSAVANGTRLHREGVDGRSASARRFRDLVRAFRREIGDDPDEGRLALARQAAALTLQAEALQAKVAAGADVDADALVRVTNALARAVSALRAKAKLRDAGPSLAEVLAQHRVSSALGEPAEGHLAADDAA